MVENIRIRSLRITLEENIYKIALISKKAIVIIITISISIVGTFIFKEYFILLQILNLLIACYCLHLLFKIRNLLNMNKKITHKLNSYNKKLSKKG
tara:strand:- start:20085 stop:20372 length:288 start_codon:yes stop_codon:yes gene_type:complete